MPKQSSLERKFTLLWIHSVKGQADLHVEHRFHPTRKWQFDFAHVKAQVAVELEGGIWTGGRHTRAQGFIDDCEKYNEAAHRGWTVFRLTTDMVNAPELERIKKFIMGRLMER